MTAVTALTELAVTWPIDLPRGDPALYLVLALRDRRQLMACPADARALMTWGERLLSFPDAGGLGQARLTDLLELELRS